MVKRARLMPLCTALLAAVAVVAGSSGRSVAAAAEHWTAVSQTAMAITGDVRFTPVRIVFQNGRAMPIAPIARPRGFPAAATQLYRATPPSDPVLLHGNRLCGARRVTYVLVSRTRSSASDVELSVYNGAHVPANEGDGLCATYFYQRVR
ncbi:MAG: hypothetical protein JO036_06180 [Candidatus Eremiobacteraeota bacterium]|nr:hypothetical protein [Candidatus Eremiobacteraeota bacterium]